MGKTGKSESPAYYFQTSLIIINQNDIYLIDQCVSVCRIHRYIPRCFSQSTQIIYILTDQCLFCTEIFDLSSLVFCSWQCHKKIDTRLNHISQESVTKVFLFVILLESLSKNNLNNSTSDIALLML